VTGTGPPAVRPSRILQVAANLAPTVEVRNHEKDLIGRIPVGQVDALVGRGWVIRRGKNRLKYVQLTPGAPWRPSMGTWRGRDNTRRIRNDAGVVVGAPRSGLEPIPIP
jgi:hypothetical protein